MCYYLPMKKCKRGKIFATHLFEQRKANGLSQANLAKSLGISQSSVAMWETNRREPSLDMLAKVAIEFDVSTDYLLGIAEYHE